MLPASMVRGLPLRVDDRAFADLDDAVTCAKAGIDRRPHQLHVRPLVSMVVDVVGDLAKEHTFRAQDAERLSDKRRVEMCEVIAVVGRRPEHQSEPCVEVLRSIAALVRNMGWVIHHHVECARLERQPSVVTNHVGVEFCINVETDDLSITASPEPAAVHRRVENSPRLRGRIKVQDPLEKLGVCPVPY